MRSLAALLILTRVAFAHPPRYQVIAEDPPPDPHVDWRETPAIVEWSTWIRLGYGVASTPPVDAARATTPSTTYDTGSTWEGAIGADASFGGVHRIGVWGEARGLAPFGGLELVVSRSPASLDMFQYDGEGVMIVRAGGGRDRATASLAWGYRCPWHLSGGTTRGTRYEIGGRLVLNATRAYRDPNDWSATLGIEFEPVGALRYLLSIRSWYR